MIRTLGSNGKVSVLANQIERFARGVQREVEKFNDNAYQRALESKHKVAIVEMYAAMNEGKTTRDDTHQTLDEMLFANLDVTIGGISWNIVFLAASQKAQALLREEILEKKAAVKGNLHVWNQYLLCSSTFLAASIYESSRLKPLAAFSVPQSAPTTRVINGFVISAGTNFVIEVYALNIRNAYWGEDSTSYNPSRFLDKKQTANRYNFWRFGFGPRQCLGKYVADLLIRVLLIHLVSTYQISLPDCYKDKEWDRDNEVWITHPKINIVYKRLDAN